MDLLYQTETDGIKIAIGSRYDPLSYTEEDFFSNYALSAKDNTDCMKISYIFICCAFCVRDCKNPNTSENNS